MATSDTYEPVGIVTDTVGSVPDDRTVSGGVAQPAGSVP